MKRTVLFLAAAILLGVALQSCDKENNNGNINGGGNGGNTTVQWVDLGLPSGLLWADRNVGAQSPEDEGNYYAWGETAPKEVYNWDNYAYGTCLDSDGSFCNQFALTKYCNKSSYGLNGFTDNLTALVASDDAATVILGGNARMPRDYEWEELMDNTTSKFTSRNGVYGFKFTASNGNSLFLPSTYDVGYGSDMSRGGYYWSSTLYLNNPEYAYVFSFESSDLGLFYFSRYYGSPVRAVRAK